MTADTLLYWTFGACFWALAALLAWRVAQLIYWFVAGSDD